MGQLEILKTVLEIKTNEKDALLSILLQDVETEMLSYTNRKEMTAGMIPLQREIACFKYNMLGNEGISSYSEGAISTSYIEGYPADIQKRLDSFRLLKMAGMKA